MKNNAIVILKVTSKTRILDSVFTSKFKFQEYLDYLQTFSNEPIKLIDCDQNEVLLKNLFTDKKYFAKNSYAYFSMNENGIKSLYAVERTSLNRNW